MEKPETTPPSHAESLTQLTAAALFGGARLTGARLTSISVQLDFFRYFVRSAEARESDSAVEPSSEVEKLSREEVENFSYISSVSHLVYATTILDTYLSDLSLFIFLLRPASLGSDKSIKLETLLESDSRETAISKLAKQVVRGLGSLSFLGRVDKLRKLFGLPIDLPDEVESHLEHYSSVRNTLVHDHGFLEVYLDSDTGVQVRQKSCPIHPTPLAKDDVRLSILCYELVISRLYEGTMNHVLKAEPDPRIIETAARRHTEVKEVFERGQTSSKLPRLVPAEND